MTASPQPVAHSVAPFSFNAHVIGTGWIEGTAAFALANGDVELIHDGKINRVTAHPDAGLLTVAGNGQVFLTGGDDGRIVKIQEDGSLTTLRQTNGSWIDALAVHKDGGFAYGSGKQVCYVGPKDKDKDKTFTAPSTARGLAFAPKGIRLAITHYNGASLWFPNVAAKPEFLEWKGSHLDAAWSPDGRFVVTSMQENALHGWRLQPDTGHMRMAGYPSKTRSFSWTSDGKWLATSGAEAVVLWPFDSKEGPLGKAPRECGARRARVARVACHPTSPVLAAGYEDGTVILVRLTDAMEIGVREPTPNSAITGLSWDGTGRRLIFGCADGSAGLFSLP